MIVIIMPMIMVIISYTGRERGRLAVGCPASRFCLWRLREEQVWCPSKRGRRITRGRVPRAPVTKDSFPRHACCPPRLGNTNTLTFTLFCPKAITTPSLLFHPCFSQMCMSRRGLLPLNWRDRLVQENTELTPCAPLPSHSPTDTKQGDCGIEVTMFGSLSKGCNTTPTAFLS